MTQEEFTTIILQADAEHLLTQASDVAINERVVVERVALGRYDSAENWREITLAEAAEIRLAQQAAAEAGLPVIR